MYKKSLAILLVGALLGSGLTNLIQRTDTSVPAPELQYGPMTLNMVGLENPEGAHFILTPYKVVKHSEPAIKVNGKTDLDAVGKDRAILSTADGSFMIYSLYTKR